MRRVAFLSVLVVLAAACAQPQVDRREGPCTLELSMLGEPGRLTAPYVVELTPQANAPDGAAELVYFASGWRGMVGITVTEPDGRVDEGGLSADSLNEGQNGLYLDVPGVWRFRFESQEAGCLHEFSIEAR